MAFNPTSPVTGGAQTGFTNPGYTIGVANAPAVNAKAYDVLTLTGTQPGATAASVSSPFNVVIYKPRQYASAGVVDGNGILRGVGYNDYALNITKGMLPLAGQQPLLGRAWCKFRVPGGADLASPGEIKAMISFLSGLLTQQPAGIGDMLIQGTI